MVSVTPVGGTATTFAYDASGQRVKTAEPSGKTTYFPFPNYEETVVGGSTIKRSSYLLAGQVVAFRVADDPVPTNNALFFSYGDHLGSTSVLQKSGDTQPVAGSWTRYRPFGSYRTAPTQTLTDRDFTGQRENRELGLLYYNARFYHPGSGRFISPDTIVPDPTNPQSFNRYSYVLNSPVNLIDPTGHCSFDADGNIDRFDCSLDEFEALPIEQRLYWMKQFMRQVSGTASWFNNIVGIIEGFVEYGLAESGSWLSIVDAGILQGIQDGYTLSKNTATYSTNNPGSLLWREFFDILNDPKFSDPERIKRWGAAEQASTDYGIGVATSRNLIPNGYEWGFLLTGNIYRGAASAFDGGLGTPVSFVTAAIGGLSGVDGDLSVDAGYMLGSFFNDPRSLWNGHSPVYWYSTTLIWANQETHRWP